MPGGSPPLALATVDLPRPGGAEDAPPRALLAGGAALLGVFDGLGGAGARQVEGEDGRRSSAYYAARTAREATAAAFASGAADYAAVIGARLAERQRLAPVATGGPVRSRLLRSYPTTAAILLVTDGSVTALWAGDSRCYALTPRAGLQQLSLDDAAADGGAMTNLLCAGLPARLRSVTRPIDGPAIFFTATDGAFASLPTPMHFELALLDALTGARRPADWAAALAARLAPLADDDVSLAAAFAGWAPARFVARRTVLAGLLTAPAEAAWTHYRPGYMALAEDA